MSKLFELMRRSQAQTSVETAKELHGEVARVFPGIRLGRSPLWVERALEVKTPPKLITEIFPLGHTNYFIHWDRRTYSWHFCAEIGFGSIVPVGSAERRRYRKSEAIKAFFYVWWRKSRLESGDDGPVPCPFQISSYVNGIDFAEVLNDAWQEVSQPLSYEHSERMTVDGVRSLVSQTLLPSSFPTGTRFYDVDGIPVTSNPAEACPRAYDTEPPRVFGFQTLMSEGVPLSEEDFRKKFSVEPGKE